ncbi:MAG: hypothetical protein COV74_07690 [Candidatus Omnitrophica bacterium CG11_big_fil_rev_8_21_14_0_20_45_26]|uniref:Putative gluconeogenesis factor n=1 Tax=Candidatus Abzuiibacterium crystallinum TaxID=1974748 RepID=A0A2H0LMY3_9BACT|nr:MAG: hypothetical protein COV74_07690 [Candidatus Omnitrophica bacterium CG11_big_fil_rev_8_21_14_0_20_45_26]PIW65212.1 MAG: hypothetical protein COW12_03295 [Candidatus Omnitrophica bacterium CG12_big_fil_rev_8_21_14_0_65_45_16]
MKFFKWLYPGIGIKRWVILASFGLGLTIVVALSAVQTISRNNVLLASFALAALIFGIFLVYMAIKNIVRTFVRALMPPSREDLASLVYESRQREYLARGPRIVAIGGGTGLSTLLAGLKLHSSNVTGIVTVTDTGGSSGRLRDDFDILPPGDIRNCLVALAESGPLIRDLFQYRFEEGSGLKGHSFGNLFITALSKVTGDFEQAIKESSKVLAIRGRVIPSTLQNVTLVAEFVDGKIIEGETNITEYGKSIKRVSLKPTDCPGTPEALEAIEDADLIIMGPGSLYTSILPNLLIKDILEKILESDALKIFVINAMTQPGETDHHSAYDHVQALISHTDPRLFDVSFMNVQVIPKSLLVKYKEKQSVPVKLNADEIRARGYEVVEGKMLQLDEQVRHDSEKLAKLIMDRYLQKTR